MTKVEVNAGVCGFKTLITADGEDADEISLKIETGCATIKKLAEGLGDTVDGYEICIPPRGEEKFVVKMAREYNTHAACPVIVGLIKCIEAESGLALKKNASITFIE